MFLKRRICGIIDVVKNQRFSYLMTKGQSCRFPKNKPQGNWSKRPAAMENVSLQGGWPSIIHRWEVVRVK